MNAITIELIKTIGSQWKFLLVLFFIIIFILKWKTIWAAIGNFTQIRVKRGHSEFEIHKNISDKEKEIVNPEKARPKEDTSAEKSEDLPDRKEHPSLYLSYHEALIEKRFDEASRIFEKIVALKDDPLKIKHDVVHNYYLRHHYGDTLAFDELEKFTSTIANDNEQLSYAFYYLGIIYQDANDYHKAVNLLNQAIEITKDLDQKANCISKLSDFHFEHGHQNNSLEVILKNIDNINEKGPKSILYISLANYYGKCKNKLLEALAYQKALELSPNDTNLLFDAAFNYSEAKESLKDLGLLLYKKLIDFNPKSTWALNNIGVAYKNLGLNIKSIVQYKNAFEQKNSLAASNIAYQLISIGFVKEASEYLEKAEEFERTHENVYDAVSSIKSAEKEEHELEEKILKIANKKFQFFNYYGNAVFTSRLFNASQSAKWELDQKPVSIEQDQNFIEISWVIGDEKHHIRGTRTNNSFTSIYKKPVRKDFFYNEDDKYTYQTIEGFGYLASNLEIKFLFEYKQEILELSFQGT